MAGRLALFCLFVGLVTLSTALTDYQEDLLEAYYRAQFFRQFAAQRQMNRTPAGRQQTYPGAQQGQPGAQSRFSNYNNPYFPLHPYFLYNDK